MILLVAKIDWLFSSKRNQILYRAKNFESFSKVFVYVHWSLDLKPTIGEIELLKVTKKNGLQNLIVLNSDSKHGVEEYVKHWDDLCDEIVVRKNIGRDLAGYRAALEIIEKAEIKEIYFFNNSIMWLPEKLNSFLINFIDYKSKVYSATDSFQPVHHMQSFALAAKDEGVSELFEVMTKIRNTKTKRATIAFGEIKLSRDLSKKQGNKPDAFFKYSRLMVKAATETALKSQPRETVFPEIDARLNLLRAAATNGQPLNPTHHLWFELYTSGFPGIKRDLLKKNPSRIPDLLLLGPSVAESDAKLIAIEQQGFWFSPKSFTDKARRKIGL